MKKGFAMTQGEIESLKRHLVRYTNHLSKTERQKKHSNAGFVEEINATKKKCSTIAAAIEAQDTEILFEVFGPKEAQYLLASTQHETIKQKVIVKSHDEVVQRTCGFCGIQCGDPKLNDWTGEDSEYEEDSVMLGLRIGGNYPEGDCRRMFLITMCPDCWERKFVPWLKEQNVELQEVDEESHGRIARGYLW